MKWINFSITFIIIFIIQTVFIPYIKIFGIVPDLLLVLVAICAVVSGRKNGVIVGALVGVLQDVFSSTVYVHTISKITVGYIIGFIKENVLGGEEAISTVTVFLVSIISAVIDVVFLFLFLGRSMSSPYYLLSTIIIYSFYNIIFVPILYPIARKTLFSE